MIRFNPDRKRELTEEEILVPAMKITDPREAYQYQSQYVIYIIDHRINELLNLVRDNPFLDSKQVYSDIRRKAEEMAVNNIKYYSRHYSYTVQQRIDKLFRVGVREEIVW